MKNRTPPQWLLCPRCGSQQIVSRAPESKTGKANFQCLACARRFIDPRLREIPPKVFALLDLLLEYKVPIKRIAVASGISKATIYLRRQKKRRAQSNAQR